MNENWVKFGEVKPVDRGYYLILYLNSDDKQYIKAVWWDGMVFKAPRDIVKEVYEYIPKRYAYYVPCMMQDEDTGYEDDRKIKSQLQPKNDDEILLS